MTQSFSSPALYVVATPIGNLEDISPRAVRVLASVDRIAAEDTRHSAKLLHHLAVSTPMTAFHEHNELEETPRLLKMLQGGKSIALISDAGTPLLSDPGYRLVRAVRAAGLPVVPVPGPSAVVAAISVAGLPSDRFVFEGFPPPKTAARQRRFAALAAETRTIIFFESPHRIQESLADMIGAFGAEREAVIARELTKQFETVRAGTLGELQGWLESDREQQQGEFVVVLHGRPALAHAELDEQTRHTIDVLRRELPLKQAAMLAAEICGVGKNALYDYALKHERNGVRERE